MAEISVEYRNINCSRKCAIPSSKIVSLEFGDESPDGSSESAFTTFFCNNRISQYDNNLIHKRNDGIEKEFFIDSQLSLSHDIHNANREPSNIDSEIDSELRELLNSSKSAKISSPLLKKDSSRGKKSDTSVKMKINSNQAEDHISDILTSLSICDENLTAKNDYSASKNDFLDNFQISDLNFSKECKNSEPRKPTDNSFFKKRENVLDLFSSLNIKDSDTHRLDKSNLVKTHNVQKLNDSECYDNFNLSDILSSINIENSNTSKFVTCNDLLESSEEINLSLKDFYCTSDSPQDVILDAKHSPNDSCASSYSDTKDDSTNSSMTNANVCLNDETNDSDSGISSFDSLKQEFSFFNSSPETIDSFDTFLEHIDEFKDINVYKDQKVKNNNEGMGMFDLASCIYEVQDKPMKDPSDESEDCMSMLDLMKSIDFKPDTLFPVAHSCSKNISSDSSCNMPLTVNCEDTRQSIDSVKDDASVIKHSVLQTQNNLDDEKTVCDDDTEQITCIDLRACIKPTKNSSIPSSPFEVSETESFKCIRPEKLELQSFNCISPARNFHDEKYNSLILQTPQNDSNYIGLIETNPSKKSKVNSKQSLFSKALGCKPKKNPLLTQTISSIKFKLYENFVNRPIYFEDNAQQSNTEPGLPFNHRIQCSEQCILSYTGRKSFGKEISCELQ